MFSTVCLQDCLFVCLLLVITEKLHQFVCGGAEIGTHSCLLPSPLKKWIQNPTFYWKLVHYGDDFMDGDMGVLFHRRSVGQQIRVETCNCHQDNADSVWYEQVAEIRGS